MTDWVKWKDEFDDWVWKAARINRVPDVEYWADQYVDEKNISLTEAKKLVVEKYKRDFDSYRDRISRNYIVNRIKKEEENGKTFWQACDAVDDFYKQVPYAGLQTLLLNNLHEHRDNVSKLIADWKLETPYNPPSPKPVSFPDFPAEVTSHKAFIAAQDVWLNLVNLETEEEFRAIARNSLTLGFKPVLSVISNLLLTPPEGESPTALLPSIVHDASFVFAPIVEFIEALRYLLKKSEDWDRRPFVALTHKFWKNVDTYVTIVQPQRFANSSDNIDITRLKGPPDLLLKSIFAETPLLPLVGIEIPLKLLTPPEDPWKPRPFEL